MKRITLILGAIILLASCKSYMISTVSAPDTQLDQSTGSIVLQNDSTLVSYNFSEPGLLNIEVFNKLNEPVYVNWEKSAIIAGNKAYSLVDDKLSIEGETSGTTRRYFRSSDTYSQGSISATLQLSKSESFIPPHTKVIRTTKIVSNIPMNAIEDSLYRKIALNNMSDGVVRSKESVFTMDNSPLVFRSYLTLYTLKDNQPKPFISQQNFFVSRVLKLNVDPANIENFTNRPGNVMVNAKSTGVGTTLTAVALSAVIVGSGVATVALEESNQKSQDKRNKK